MECQSQCGINERLYEVLTQIIHNRLHIANANVSPFETSILDLFAFILDARLSVTWFLTFERTLSMMSQKA